MMEPVNTVSMAMLLSKNSSSSQPLNITGAPVFGEWELIQTVIPPYILSLSVFGLLGNGFVLLVFLLHRDRLNIPEIYLGNLALADFILLFCLPFWAMNIQNNFNWTYGDALCKIVNSSVIINFYTSMYTLVMISIDRYLALVKTMNARWLRRTLYAKVICGTLWIFGLLMSLPTMIHRKVKFVEEVGTLSCVLDYGTSWILAHQILVNVVGFFLPLLVIGFCSCNIVRALKQRREAVCLPEGSDSKATALVYAVTILFVACWGPFQLFTVLDVLCELNVLNEETWSHALDIGHQISVYLAFLSSGLNPVLYVFSGQYFRRKVRAICRNARHGRRGSDMTIYQRSVVSTYINRTEQIKHVVVS